MKIVNAIRGTRDIYPPEVQKWLFAERVVREVCATYGYDEIRTPMFESTELFTRSIGEVTDIVKKQMYTFEDAGGESITLRPEGTAPVVRAFVEHALDRESSVTKWYYLGPMFRYERPQKGRYRQFGQWGIEVLGTENPAVDAEVIEVLIVLLKKLGLSEFSLHLNSVGCLNCRPKYTAALQEALRSREDQMCGDCRERIERNPLRVLDCKVEADQPIIDALPAINDYLCDDCRTHFDGVQKYLRMSDIGWTLDKRLVRGLDYYTKTTFEVVLGGLGAQNSVAGGGRYDRLVEDLGGKPTKAIGFALGMDRLVLVLPEKDREQTDIRVFVAAMSEAAFDHAYSKVQLPLRAAGIPAEIDYQRRSLKAAMRQADKRNVPWVIIVGDEEMQEGKVTLKNMKDGGQERLTIEEAIGKVR